MNTKRYVPILVIGSVFMISAMINLNSLENYANQTVPAYITKNNSGNNPTTDKGATLGRVLFYDKKLSANNTIACGSCHIQQFAFSDTAALSKGHLGGNTGRHAMRLSNPKFANEVRFFWDERATSLEDQTTRPIKDAVEMGWSGTGGQGNFDSLVKKMHGISYYKTLFKFVYGDTVITETRVQNCLAQFIRSIQSFDSKFDAGLAMTGNLGAPFANFTLQENQGKKLFLDPPPQGGAGCQGCHAAPEFDINPNSRNNGVIAVASNTNMIDLTNTRAPSLRNLFNTSGILNGPLMHNATFKTIDAALLHYNSVPQNTANTNLDPKLAGPGANLNLTQTQRDALAAFLKTLSGTDIYTNPKWSDPFDNNGNLSLITTGVNELQFAQPLVFSVYPNPSKDYLNFSLTSGNFSVSIMDGLGRVLLQTSLKANDVIDISAFPAGYLYIRVTDLDSKASAVKCVIKN